MSNYADHGWRHAPKTQGGTDPIPGDPDSLADPVRVFSTEAMETQTSEADWSGQIMGRGWTAGGSYVGGNVVRIAAGNVRVDTWSNTFDDRDRQWMPHGAYAGATFGGWTRNQQIIRNRWTAGTFANADAKTVYLESRDGSAATKIADVTIAPFTSMAGTPFKVGGYPVESTTPNVEGRVLVFCGTTVEDGLFLYDPALGTTVAFADYAAQLGAMLQRGNQNLGDQQRPITNRERHGLGLRVMQEFENQGSCELFNAAGTSIFTLAGGAATLRDHIGKFSPDGRWLCYSGFTALNDPECWLLDLTTLTEAQLDTGAISIGQWDWSPNSDYIVFNDSDSHLYLCSIPDGYFQKIADSGAGYLYDPQWKGNAIVAFYDEPTFTLSQQIVEIEPSDGTWVALDDSGTYELGGSGPTSDVTGSSAGFVLSPNGKRLCYPKAHHLDAYSNFVNDVWVATTHGLAGS